MSLHKTYTDTERAALRLHGLNAEGPSQLSDAFVNGLRHARAAFDAVMDQEKDITVRYTVIDDYERALREETAYGVPGTFNDQQKEN
jgi:succinate dehydrogenase/fumarate reductase flavoprotein subunit